MLLRWNRCVCVCVCVCCERMSRYLGEGWSNCIELLCYYNSIVMVMKWVQNNELFFHYFLTMINIRIDVTSLELLLKSFSQTKLHHNKILCCLFL